MSEPKGAINVYVCQTCGARIVTKNMDEGTTPFMISCRVKGCERVCYSSFYRVLQTQQHTHEWYRPKTAGERKKIADASTKHHVDMGGLLLRDAQTGKDET